MAKVHISHFFILFLTLFILQWAKSCLNWHAMTHAGELFVASKVCEIGRKTAQDEP